MWCNGIKVKMHQLMAYQKKKSAWCFKEQGTVKLPSPSTNSYSKLISTKYIIALTEKIFRGSAAGFPF